jgi:hypothetical protein
MTFASFGRLRLLASLWCVSGLALAQPLPIATTPSPANASSAPGQALDIPFASAHASNFQVPSAPNAWGGPRTGNEPTLSDRVVRYDIDATLDADKHTVDGKETLSWRNRSDSAVSTVYLHMYLNAFDGPGSTYFKERDVLAADGDARGTSDIHKGQWGYIDLQRVAQAGTPVKWTYVHPDNGPAADHTVVRLDLPQPVPAHATMVLDIDFHDQLPRVIARTGWFGGFHLVAQWFPKIGVLELAGERGATAPRWNVHEFHFNSEFYADYGSYDVHLTVPTGYTVGAVGEARDAPVDKGNKVTLHFTQDDVHDFAWVAAPMFKTLEAAWTGPGSLPVSVRVIYPSEYAAAARATLKATTDSLTYFSRTLGPYPYRTVTAVVPPYNADDAGGMEYPTFFTVDGYPSVTPGTATQGLIDFVTIHEFGHGYFYGILGFNEFEEPMLDEGLNEFWDQRMLRERGEKLDVTTPLLRWFGIAPSIGGFVFERISGVLDDDQPVDSLDTNSWERLTSRSYGTVYSRTATTMHDLEERLGKGVTERAFTQFYQRWKFRHPSAADLRAVLEEISGKPAVVDAVFAQQVYGTERIDDSVIDANSVELTPEVGTEVRDGRHVEMSEEQVSTAIENARANWKKQHPNASADSGPYPWLTTVTVQRKGAPVAETLLVKFTDGSSETLPWNDDARWRRFTFDKPAKAVSAELDPERRIYLDANKLNDSYAVKTDGSAARRWSSDIAALLQSLYTMVATL